MAIRAKLTTLEELQAAAKAPGGGGGGSGGKVEKARREFSEEERTLRKERVAKAKDALARSVGAKGDHVAPARAALKKYLQQLNEPKQPDDQKFEELIAAPFTAPPKKKATDRRF